MYTTKHIVHEKNTKDFIAVGDSYIKPKIANSRIKGTQFMTKIPKKGQVYGGFDKYPEHKGDTYIDRFKAPEKKFKNIGFGSTQPDTKGQFTLDIMTKQWRETLKKEMGKMEGTIIDDDVEPMDMAAAHATFKKTYPNPKYFQTQVPFHGMDIGNHGRHEGYSTPICNKCTKDTFYCRHRIQGELSENEHELRRGGFQDSLSPTSYNQYGNWTSSADGPKLCKPASGRVSSTKSFFDTSHLVPGWTK